ncbi:hypothetical protein [Cellulosimicrobium cellulans]|uniref:hypothetical protein n=1 Tax=Cellulosimicrobium cellulans TaxID=1710 RepID=UPI00084948B9|nr:hypothetical protein [Cellulosimicrobium cellulans]
MTSPAAPSRAPSAVRGALDVRAVVLASVAPVVGAAAVVTVSLVWAPRLPDPVATHWSVPAPDAFGPLAATTAPPAVLALVLGLGLGLWGALWRVPLGVRRPLVGLGTGLVVLLLGTHVLTLAAQLDLADARDARLGLSALLGATAVAVVAGVLASRVPRETGSVAWAEGTPPADLPRAAAPGAVVTEAIGLGARLEAGPDGLVVRWLGGRPVVVPLDRVERAEVRAVDPLGDFGGWGPRVGLGGHRIGEETGFVVRRGPAVVVHVAGGTRIVVTTRRAEEAAGALNSAIDAAR